MQKINTGILKTIKRVGGEARCDLLRTQAGRIAIIMVKLAL